MPTTASATGTVMRAAMSIKAAAAHKEKGERTHHRLAPVPPSIHNARGGNPHGASRARARLRGGAGSLRAHGDAREGHRSGDHAVARRIVHGAGVLLRWSLPHRGTGRRRARHGTRGGAGP